MKKLIIFIFTIFSAMSNAQDIHKPCQNQRDSVINVLAEIESKSDKFLSMPGGLSPVPRGTYRDLRDYAHYKFMLVDSGECIVTPQHEVSVEPDCYPCLVHVVEIIPADTSWVYPDPTFDGFMAWKLRNYLGVNIEQNK